MCAYPRAFDVLVLYDLCRISVYMSLQHFASPLFGCSSDLGNDTASSLWKCTPRRFHIVFLHNLQWKRLGEVGYEIFSWMRYGTFLERDYTKLATKYQIHICRPDITDCKPHTGPPMLCNFLRCWDGFQNSRYPPQNPAYCLVAKTSYPPRRWGAGYVWTWVGEFARKVWQPKACRNFREETGSMPPMTTYCADTYGTVVVYAEGSNQDVAGSIPGHFFRGFLYRYFDACF